MNGEIPSVPITTLAGISSLTDLLPEMPLPSPLQQTLSNKSLLFHPRVAEEANILLSGRDEYLAPLLAQSLSKTSADHIELKDHYAASEHPVDQQQNVPELLKAILSQNPNVFDGPGIRPVPNAAPPPAVTAAPPVSTAQWSQQQLKQQVLQQQTLQQPLQMQQKPKLPTQLHMQQSPQPQQKQQPTTQLQMQQSPQHQSSHLQQPPQPQLKQQILPQVHQSPQHIQQMHQSPQQQMHQSPQQQMHQSPQQQMHQSPQQQMHQSPQQHQVNQSPQHPYQSVQHLHQPSQTLHQSPQHQKLVQPPHQNQIPPSPQSYQLHPGLPPSQQFQPNFVHKQQVASISAPNSQYPAPPVLMRSSVITMEKDMHNGNIISSPSSSSSSSGTTMPPVLLPQLGQHTLPNNVNSLSSKSVNPSIPNHEHVNKIELSAPPTLPLVHNSSDPKVNIHESCRHTPINNTRSNLNSNKPLETLRSNYENLTTLKEPVVVLDKVTAKDQEELVTKKLKEQANKPNHNHMIKSDSEEDDKNKKRMILKTRRETRPAHYNEENNGDGENTSMAERIRKRKREEEDAAKEEPFIPPKPKLQKVERKLVPVLEMLSIEELMETNTYHRFNRTAEKIFDSMEDVNLTMEDDEDDVPPEVLIPKYQLHDLTSEAAKLKNLGATSSVPAERLIRLLSILEKNIRDGAKVTPLADPDDDEDQQKLWMELAMERIMRAVDASLTVLYILTSPKMSKRVYIEDVIDRVVIFAKFQLHNTVYPAFDPVYRVSKQEKKNYSGSARKKRQHTKEVREKSVLTLYTKLSEVVGLISELLAAQTLTDTTVLHASSMGVSPFFVENISELQLSSLKLVTTIFTKYEKHRKLLLDDILASMARLPSTKRNLRTYRLNSSDYIQMLTALVLQLIQCMVVLPETLGTKSERNPVDPDVFIMSKFKAAKNTATSFLHVFLKKCSSKSEEIDYRPIFENLIQDLLVTVNKPEWPAAELMLSVLGSLLVSSIINKSLEMSLRMASLDYLGVVSARLRKDSVQSKLKLASIDLIIRDIRYEELKDEDGNVSTTVEDVKDDDERTVFLQRVLLDYLAVQSQSEPSLSYARYFHITQWYQDIITSAMKPVAQKSKPVKVKKKKRKRIASSDEESEESEDEVEENIEETLGSDFKKVDAKKKFLISKITPYVQGNTSTQILQSYVDYESAELIARYLGSKQNFAQSFDTYLKRIISVVMENSVLIRTKAIKCLTSIVEVDAEILASKDMQIGVSVSFLDQSTSVREAAVDLVGKYILNKPELIDKYYTMLSARILDTGVSVRKRVIRILKDICIEYPEYPKIPEICVKMIRRVGDEEGIRKLVMEVFQNMWFLPVREKPLDTKTLMQKVSHITDVVHACQDIGLEWFEQLLQSLFKPRDEGKEKDDVVGSTKHVQVEPPKQLLLACQQIVNCLIDYSVRLDSTDDRTPQKLLSCLQTLFLFAKIRPQLLIDHATIIQPYLSLRCHTLENFQVISYAAKILELVVPLIENASESFLANLESDSVKLVVTQRPNMITSSCITCLSSIVNNVTKNFKLVRDCFTQFYKVLTNFKDYHDQTAIPNPTVVKRFTEYFKKAVFVIGLLLRHFNFTDPNIIGDTLAPNIKDQVVEILMYFLQMRAEYRFFILKAIGHICIRHYELMLTPELKTMYQEILTDPYADTQIKKQVLNNIEIYLSEEEKRMIQQDLEWAKLSKNENLKEMCDVSSGMASTIVQLYMKQIVESFLHPSLDVRHAVLKVIQLILAQGLLNPVQLVPYLICMSTDPEKPVSVSADKQLQDIEKKYPGFIYMKSQQGIRLSYQFQKTLQRTHVVRGFREKEGEIPGALNGFLYSILKSKQQRRAIALSFLKQFDEQVKTSLEQMLYLTDNMAYFPYQVQDEPLFIIHNIDIILSVNGTNLIQSFKEALKPVYGPHREYKTDAVTGAVTPFVDEMDEDMEPDTLLGRLPHDAQPLLDIMTASQGCILLLMLKNHLKAMYGFNDARISQYSPSENSKLYEKALQRKSNAKFNPAATLKKLHEMKSTHDMSEDERKALVAEFLDFKELIMSLDTDEADEDDLKPAGTQAMPPNTGVDTPLPTTPSVPRPMPPPTPTSTPHLLNITPRVPKLTIIAPTPPGDYKSHKSSHHKSSKKSEKHKKHPKKRKKQRMNSSDEDEESDENSDPDYE